VSCSNFPFFCFTQITECTDRIPRSCRAVRPTTVQDAMERQVRQSLQLTEKITECSTAAGFAVEKSPHFLSSRINLTT
jgi:hypothetical protein